MSRQEDNLRMLDDIIETLRSGRYAGRDPRETQALFMELETLRSSGNSVEDGHLKSVFKTHPGLLDELRTGVAEKALAFVKDQLARLEEVKKQRPFTPEERSFALDCLVPLLSTLSELVSPKAPRDIGS